MSGQSASLMCQRLMRVLSKKEEKKFQERRLVAMKSLREVKRMLTATMPEGKEFGG